MKHLSLRRRLLSILLTVAMLFSFPVPAFSAEPDRDAQAEESKVALTAIYAHLDTTDKDVSAAAMSQALNLPDWGGGYGWQRN